MTDLSLISVVIVPIEAETGESGIAQLSRSLAAIENQTAAAACEILVPHSARSALSRLCVRHPRVRFLATDLPSSISPTDKAERLRAAAARASRGDLVAMTEDHVRADPDWIARMIGAHDEKHAVIGGAIENGEDRWLSWAAYFADLGRYHNPIPAAESPYASLVNVSYKRAALERVRPVWQERFNETEVHAALLRAEESIALSPRIVVRQHRSVRFIESLAEFFAWGRRYGRARASLAGAGKRLALLAASPLTPAVLLLRGGLDAWRKKRLFERWLWCLPLSIALNAAWACGEAAGYLRGSSGGD